MSKWYYDERDNWHRSGGFLIASVGLYVVSDKAENEPEWDHLANARLIAAAPELLEALEYLRTRLDDIVDIRIADEVIAKAK